MKTVLLSAKPEPVTPAPDLEARIENSDNRTGQMAVESVVQLSFLSRGAHQFSVRIGKEYARALGKALTEAAR